ncbi:preprotein translocase subunit SecE [Jatrophihabitans sp. YIM 134969]
MPTASSGLPDRSGSDKGRKARLSKDDDRLLSDGALPEDEVDVDETDDDLVDDDLAAEDSSELDEADRDEDDEDEDDREASGTTLTKKRTAKAGGGTATKARPSTRARRPKDQRTGNPFAALLRFVREVVAEVRKVLWPTRRELIVYTVAVIIFVAVLISIVGGLDFGFAKLVLLVFGE